MIPFKIAASCSMLITAHGRDGRNLALMGSSVILMCAVHDPIIRYGAFGLMIMITLANVLIDITFALHDLREPRQDV